MKVEKAQPTEGVWRTQERTGISCPNIKWGTTFINRIVAIPGDVIEIRNKQVTINGALLDDHGYTQRIDPGIIDGSLNSRDNLRPIRVPKNAYFVLGDNRDQSLDSRFWGYVDASKIRGKATFVYWSWSGTGKWYEWARWERISQGIH